MRVEDRCSAGAGHDKSRFAHRRERSARFTYRKLIVRSLITGCRHTQMRTRVALIAIVFGFALSGLAAAQPDLHAELERMVKLYRSFGLPVPPREAKLVLIEFDDTDISDGVYSGHITTVALQVANGVIYYGITPTSLRALRQRVGKVEPLREVGAEDPALARVFPFAAPSGELFRCDNLLATAIQLAAVGREPLAEKILAHALKEATFSSGFDITDAPTTATGTQRVLRLALAQALAQWPKKACDRQRVLATVRRIEDAGFGSDPERLPYPYSLGELGQLRRSMEAALVPQSLSAGSEETLIAGFVDEDSEMEPQAPSRFQSVIQLGFAGIPTMLRHLHDYRLTRIVRESRGNEPTRILTVSDVMRDALSLFCSGAGSTYFMNRSSDRQLADWWREAKRKGEKAYCREHLVGPPRRPGEDTFSVGGHAVLISAALLAVCEARYHDVLKEVYEEVRLHRPDVYLAPLEDALNRIERRPV